MSKVLAAPSLSPASSGWVLSRVNPFPGLRPYEEADADWLFGRGGEINELLKRLRRLHFVAVVGASGSGKSSVVRAGVMPQIRDGYLDSEWTIAAFRPGERPIANLAEALVDADPRLSESTQALRDGSLGLVRALAPARGKVLILVDQFEEIFQFARSTGDAAQEEVKEFLKLLLAAASSVDVDAYVIITMRLEWLNECAAYAGLAEAINEGIYLVPQMTRRQFQQAILGPLELANGSITSALLGRMLNDLDGKTDQLPVLQHALMRIWERTGASDAFAAPAYEAVGTFTDCLSAHAEEVYAGLNDREKVVAELLFRNITQVYQNRKIRRPRSIGDMARATPVSVAEYAAVIPAFSQAGRSFLVTTEGDLRAETIVDVSHEALIRQWVRLCGWVEDEADKQSRISRLEVDAAEWDRDRKRFRPSLYRGYRLQRAEELRSSLEPSGKALSFLNESRRERTRQRVIKRGSITVGLLLVVVFAFVLYSVRSRGLLDVARVEQQRAQAETRAADLQARRAENLRSELEQRVVAANGNQTALAAITREIQADKVYVQYVPANAGFAKTVQGQLEHAGYVVPGLERVDPMRAPGQSQVRFFHPEDRGDANKIASLLRGVAGGVGVQQMASGVTPTGQFEVWLVGGAVPAVAAKTDQPVTPAVVPTPAAVTPVWVPTPTLNVSASAERVVAGGSVTLTWRSEHASEVDVVGSGAKEPNGSMLVTPKETTIYSLMAKNDTGLSPTRSVRVEVVTPAVAPPAPVVATPAPAPVAVTAVASEQTSVRAALTRYREAYESESLDDVRKAWPSVSKNDQKNMKTVFDNYNAIRLTLSCGDSEIRIDGSSATANCRQGITYTQKGKKLPEQASTNTFRLKKVSGTWVLDGVQ